MGKGIIAQASGTVDLSESWLGSGERYRMRPTEIVPVLRLAQPAALPPCLAGTFAFWR